MSKSNLKLVKPETEAPLSYALRIPIDQLCLGHESEADVNARTSTRETGLEALAVSIKAHGLISPLLVRPIAPDSYQVVAGNRRLLALRRLEGASSFDEVDCIVRPDLSANDRGALEASLAENVERIPLDAIEECEAFAKVASQGATVAEIAARFAVPERRVRQRLALGTLIPEVRDAVRAGTITIETAQAFTLGDAAAQREVWESQQDRRYLHQYDVRGLLAKGGVALSTKTMKFVGVEAYVAAGGQVVQDLFDRDEGGGFAADAGLLNRLARAKLEKLAEELKAEGWAWVALEGDEGVASVYQYRRFEPPQPEPRPITKKDSARLGAIRKEQDGFKWEFDPDNADVEARVWQDDEGNEAPLSDADIAQIRRNEALEREEEEIRAKYERKPITSADYPAAVKAKAGVILSIRYDGEASADYGLLELMRNSSSGVRTVTELEDIGAGSTAPKAKPEKPKDPALGQDLSQALYEDLMKHMTAALQATVAVDPEKAQVLLVATLVHQLAGRLGRGYPSTVGTRSPVFVTPKPISTESRYGSAAADARERAAREVDAVAGKLAFPAILEKVAKLDRKDRDGLLACCVALTLSVEPTFDYGRTDENRAVSKAVADYVAPDLAGTTLTAENYWSRVSSGQIANAIKEASSGSDTPVVAKGTKAEHVAMAERYITKGWKNWLPPVLRTPSYDPPGGSLRDRLSKSAKPKQAAKAKPTTQAKKASKGTSGRKSR